MTFIDRIRRSDFFKNLLILLSGSAIAQALPVLISPILSRLYTTADFAVFGIYYSTGLMLSVIASGRFDTAIVIPKSNDDGDRLMILGCVSSICVATFSFFILHIFRKVFIDYTSNPEIERFIPFISITILIVGLYQSTSFWLIRNRMFRSISVNKVSQRIFEGGVNISLGWANVGAGLIVADIIGRAAMLAVSVWQIFNSKYTIKTPSFRVLWRLIKEYRSYPLYLAPSTLANSISLHVPVLFVANSFDNTVSGLYNFSRYVIGAPLAFIGQALSQVILERLAVNVRTGKPIRSDFIKLNWLLGGVALCFSLPILILGPILFEFVFGNEWSGAGLYSQVLVFGFAIRFIVSPLTNVLLVMKRIKAISIWNWMHLGAILLLVPISKLEVGIIEFLMIYTALELVLYSVYWVVIFDAVTSHDKDLRLPKEQEARFKNH